MEKTQALYNSRHRVKELGLSPLQANTRVMVTDLKCYATIKDLSSIPRSYWLQMDHGTRIRRNRQELIPSEPNTQDLSGGMSMHDYLTALRARSASRREASPPRTSPPPQRDMPSQASPPRTSPAPQRAVPTRLTPPPKPWPRDLPPLPVADATRIHLDWNQAGARRINSCRAQGGAPATFPRPLILVILNAIVCEQQFICRIGARMCAVLYLS